MAKVPFSPALQGVRILIVEDESILAMDLENRLKGEGCEVIGLVSREAKALDLLERDRPDAVVLDLNLNGKLPSDLVDALVAQQIPFVIVTGYSKRQFDSPALQGAPRLDKPIKTEDLVRALSDLVRAAD
jgi:two-component SAPR family response regulator